MKEVVCCEDCRYLSMWTNGCYECQYWGTSRIDITDGCTKGKKGINCFNAIRDCDVKEEE